MATIYQSIEILSKEKGIDTQIILEAVKDAMLVAARKHFRTEEDMVAELDEGTGSINVFAVRKVVSEVEDPQREFTVEEARQHDPSAEIDSEVRIPMNTSSLGRISAQTAKQVILQKVREAERETMYAEYSGRVGDLVNCAIKRNEGLDYVVELGKAEARLPKREQSRTESFSVADRVRCVIKSVEKAGKNAGVIVSRASPELVMRLFEQEVPEIYDGTVVIKGCAREPGERTKIAVSSRDRDVDSVGACVGMKGMRVQSIIRELRGEKIDIIQYSEDPVIFATNALSPAKISRVTIADPAERQLEVIVDDSQLSLAIGKKGQNVRLGAKLLGWRIDIKSEEEKRQEVETEMAALVVPGAPVSVLMDHGLSEKLVEKLTIAGVATVEKLGSMTPEQLEEISGIGPKMVEKIQTAVVNYYGQFEAAMGEGGELPAPTGGSPADAAPAGETVADATPAGEAVADAAPAGEAVADAAPAGEAVADAAPAGEAVADAAPAGEAVADAAPAGEEATVDAVSDDGVSQEAADENTVVEEIAAGGAEPLPESRETESDTIGESDRTV